MWVRLLIYISISFALTYVYLVTPGINIAGHQMFSILVVYLWDMDILGLITHALLTATAIFLGLVLLFGLRPRRY